MGSLMAAVASYLRARQAQGKWFLRIEDIDPPREAVGAASNFLTTLEHFGFEWDGAVIYQSHRHALYRSALARLAKDGLAYRCVCSRKQLKMAVESGQALEGVYPGTCLVDPPPDNLDANWRFAAQHTFAPNKRLNPFDSVPPARLIRSVAFHDALQGQQTVRFGRDQGDFVIWRKGDLPSYQLAVSVDDLDQGITEVVRGIDLLQETAGQVMLHHALGQAADEPSVEWVHIPVVVDQHGNKLSKQAHAAPIDTKNAAQHLCDALSLLGLKTEPSMHRAALQEIWALAIDQWTPKQLYMQRKASLD